MPKEGEGGNSVSSDDALGESRENDAGSELAQSAGRSERRALAIVLGAVCVYLIFAAVSRSCVRRSVELDRPDERFGDLQLDLNHASWADLLQLPGVGPALAERILEYRDSNGPFERVEELGQVEGIGPKLQERVRPFVSVEDGADDSNGTLDAHGTNEERR